jgi:hypothetical protein
MMARMWERKLCDAQKEIARGLRESAVKNGEISGLSGHLRFTLTRHAQAGYGLPS